MGACLFMLNTCQLTLQARLAPFGRHTQTGTWMSIGLEFAIRNTKNFTQQALLLQSNNLLLVHLVQCNKWVYIKSYDLGTG